MGNAAWRACKMLSPTTLKDKNDGVRMVRPYHFEFLMPYGAIPLNVTLLPLKQNLRFPEQNQLIQEDFKNFMEMVKN